MAARSRVWSSLSAAYRARLTRAGISPRDYEAGASLKAARGHSQTPEKPSEYAKHPGKFRKYAERRKPLTQEVGAKKERIFRNRIKYDGPNSWQYVTKGNSKEKILPPTLAQLALVAAMTDEEFEDFQYEKKEDDDWRFLWYH